MNDDATLHDGKLQEVARRLGARAADRLDVERAAQAVVARLRTEPRTQSGAWVWMQPTWLRVAAVVVMVVGAGVILRSRLHHQPQTTALVTAAGAELNDLSAEQLRQLLEAVGGGETQQVVASQDVSLEDLSPPELRALLESLEG
jgi:hypothetical protein